MFSSTRVVCKVRGLILLLRVGTLWRCGDGLFFETPPLASNAPLKTLHPLLENVLQTVDHFEISCHGAPFSWLEKKSHGVRSELNSVFPWKKWIGGTPLEHQSYSPDLTPWDFWVFPTMKMDGAPRQIWKRSTVCSTFSRSGWSVVRSAPLAKGGTPKKRPSPHLHEV
jgi:hypothetical protein